MCSAVADDDPEVHRIEFEVPWPPWTAYAYLVASDEPILVDAGAPGEDGWEALLDGLESAGYAPEDVEHLLVTHPHTDHDGQVATLLEAADPTLYVPEGVPERLSRDPADLAAVVRANAVEAGHPNPDAAVERSVDSLRRNADCLPPEAVDVVVADGDSFEAGGVTFEAVHVPGHQVNQVAFRAGERLFAGDALIEPFRPAALHVGYDRGCFDCVDAFYDGLVRLDGLEVARVFPGHGPVFSDVAGAVERTRRDLDALVDDCHLTLERLGESSPYALTETRVEDPRRIDFSVFESMGALARLERHGLVTSARQDGVRVYRTA